MFNIALRSLSPRPNWHHGPRLDGIIMSASFNGADIYIITDKQTGYHFDANLKLRGVELPLAVLVPPIVCHGFHSNRLACGHAASLTVIDTHRRALLQNIQIGPHDTISDLSMSEKFVVVGTVVGKVYLIDYSETDRLSFTAGDYVHSVSIHGSMILAATSSRVYIWDLRKGGLPYSLKSYTINPLDDILWVCFNPFERPSGCIPFLVGRSGHSPMWERDFRPMIKRRYGLIGKELALSVTGELEKELRVRDLKSKRIIGSFALNGEPQMLWSDGRSIFVVYLNSNKVEMMRIGHRRFITARFESVSLLLPDGP